MVVSSQSTAKKQIFLTTFLFLYAHLQKAIVYLHHLLQKTNTRKNSLPVTNKDILSIIKSLDSSKTHGYDNISIKMIKICSESVTIPLKIIFEGSLKKEYFQKYGKKLM